MTNITLKVEPAQLSAKADELNNQKSQVMNLAEEARGQIASLTGIWTSEAATEYQNKYSKVQNDVENVLAIISEYVSDLKDISNIYATAERQAKSAAEGLPEDGVFR